MAEIGSFISIAQGISPLVTVLALLLLMRLDSSINKLRLTIALEYASLTALRELTDRVKFLEQRTMQTN